MRFVSLHNSKLRKIFVDLINNLNQKILGKLELEAHVPNLKSHIQPMCNWISLLISKVRFLTLSQNSKLSKVGNKFLI